MPSNSTSSSNFSICYFTATTNVDPVTIGGAGTRVAEYYNPSPMKKPALAVSVLPVESIPMGAELLVYYKRNRPPGKYEEGHRHQGEILYQNIQDLLARFFIKVHYESGPISNWREWCIGISSVIFRDNAGRRFQENLHMPMFDYDGKNIKAILRKDIQALQKKWDLGPATIFQTKKGFHVYFMTDAVSWGTYRDMLSEVKCCEGFKHCALNAGYGVLRVSAKYSHFDIKLDNVMLPEKAKAIPARKTRKARVVEALLALGERCGTHIASLCPEWAHYREDAAPWKPATSRKKATAEKSAEFAGKVGGFGFTPPPGKPLGYVAHEGLYPEPSKKPKLILKPRNYIEKRAAKTQQFVVRSYKEDANLLPPHLREVLPHQYIAGGPDYGSVADPSAPEPSPPPTPYVGDVWVERGKEVAPDRSGGNAKSPVEEALANKILVDTLQSISDKMASVEDNIGMTGLFGAFDKLSVK